MNTVEILIRPSAEEERVGVGEYLSGLRHSGVRRGPAAVLKTVAWVFVGASGCLHHAIQAQIGADHDATHRRLLLTTLFQKPGKQYTNKDARTVATAMRMAFLTLDVAMP